ncbi:MULTISPECIES: hypothetical protein [unclassified Nostoc]|nr:hypothetical protein [Nostoc sp. 'Peltigera membranacea cyanobiont' 213]
MAISRNKNFLELARSLKVDSGKKNNTFTVRRFITLITPWRGVAPCSFG